MAYFIKETSPPTSFIFMFKSASIIRKISNDSKLYFLNDKKNHFLAKKTCESNDGHTRGDQNQLDDRKSPFFPLKKIS